MADETYKTEFFETAVSLGFYGADTGGIFGKKDNVRKYWEDMFIKLMLRPFIEKLLKKRDMLRVVDLGCGSGEGFKLLTHIPIGTKVEGEENGFLIRAKHIETYIGLDISDSMVSQGIKNYAHQNNVQFLQSDLSKGFPLMSQEPFDIYFSSYASLSHLTKQQLVKLTEQVFSHSAEQGLMVFDMFGRFSPEWPIYWDKSNDEMLPYNMAYLFPPEKRRSEKIESFQVCYWTAAELVDVIYSAAAKTGKTIKLEMKDRSIFVGRHIDTGIFNGVVQSLRYQVNRLFDHGYRGEVAKLKIDLAFLEDYKNIQAQAYGRICEYSRRWNMVIALLEALMKVDNAAVAAIITPSPPELSDELKMLAWLFRNASRFPVVDFWASVIGPQVACILRNLEFSLPPGLGCGHGLICVAEISR